jgi:hypothetical protein
VELPPFVIPLISAVLGAGGGGAIVIAWLNRKPGLITAESQADAATVKQWSELYTQARSTLSETRVELAQVRSESEKIRSSYYGLLGTFVEFRNYVRTEISGIVVRLDQKDYDAASAQLETLGRHVAGVKLPTER